MTSIILDTLRYENPVKIENAVQYENLISRLDAVISTRLHGMVFALKRGVPVVAIDAIAGGAKVTAQAKAVGWPLVLNSDTIDADQISDSVIQ
jgi:polysaccharide pyruvyl transferase WcaK-like protein